jgi:hypothetical protein
MPGSVEVNETMVVESYAHVHHIVSNVRGRLVPGTGPGEAIRAVFPGGTITGCPKDADLGKQLLTETRTRAETLYKAAKGEGALEKFITGVIRQADLATARALCEEYESAVDKAAPLACPKCGEKLSRQSSKPEGDGKLNADGKRAEDYKL